MATIFGHRFPVGRLVDPWLDVGRVPELLPITDVALDASSRELPVLRPKFDAVLFLYVLPGQVLLPALVCVDLARRLHVRPTAGHNRERQPLEGKQQSRC